MLRARTFVPLLLVLVCFGFTAHASTRASKAQTFLKLLQQKKFKKATTDFSPTMKRLFGPTRLKGFWQALQAQAGAFEKQVGQYSKQLNYAGKTFQLEFLVLKFKLSKLDMRVVFNDKNQIAGLRMHPHRAKAARNGKREAVARRFVRHLVARKYKKAAGSFDAVMKKVFAIQRLKNFWEKLQTQVGAFKKQGRIHHSSVKVRGKSYFPTLVAVTFAKATLDFRIVFNDKSEISGLRLQAFQDKKVTWKAPAYVKAGSFQEVPMNVGTGKYPLKGKLTLPKGTGKVPGVVLVHGSGAHDMDETIGPNKVFRDLAWGLSSRGVAVLRYTKRNKAWPRVMMKQVKTLTLEHEVTLDAIQAARQLLKHPRISKVYVLGHSLGGYAAPLIAKKAPFVSGIIIMAGNSRPLETLILEQYNYIFGLDGKYSKQEKALLADMKKRVKRVRTGDLSKAKADQLPLNLPPAYWAYLRAYNQRKTAQEIKQPILVLQGGRDYQVTKVDFALWKKTLAAKKNVTYHLYPSLNHLFLTGKGRSTPKEYRKPGHVEKKVVQDVAAWVTKQK